jgi:hypothetical protein
MKLPTLLVTFLPKNMQAKYVNYVWDNKSDESILESYKDATEWIELSSKMASETLVKIAADCQDRLDKYIMPQINKRGLVI